MIPSIRAAIQSSSGSDRPSLLSINERLAASVTRPRNFVLPHFDANKNPVFYAIRSANKKWIGDVTLPERIANFFDLPTNVFVNRKGSGVVLNGNAEGSRDLQKSFVGEKVGLSEGRDYDAPRREKRRKTPERPSL